MTSKYKTWVEGTEKIQIFQNAFEMIDYQFKNKQTQLQVNIYEPHGNYKSKTYNRYTKTGKKGRQHINKENHQGKKLKEEKNREELPLENK